MTNSNETGSIMDDMLNSFITQYIDAIYFSKLKPSAIIPSKREEDGCYDFYACFDEDFIEIPPYTIKMIPTGIASAFSSKYRIGLRERGSSGTKGLSVRAGQVDSGYRGEIFVPINNTTNKLIIIAKKHYLEDNWFLRDSEYITVYPYEKGVCQGALEDVPRVQIKEIPYEELKKFASERGDGMLGSSKK